MCVCVCLCAVDELLKPLDTVCNMLHLSSLGLNGKDNEKAHGGLAVLAVSVCLSVCVVMEQFGVYFTCKW